MALVRLRGPLKQMAGGDAGHQVDGDTVAALLLELERVHPALRGWILDERGAVRRHINVFVDGEYGRGDTAVAPDTQVDIVPAISGG